MRAGGNRAQQANLNKKYAGHFLLLDYTPKYSASQGKSTNLAKNMKKNRGII